MSGRRRFVAGAVITPPEERSEGELDALDAQFAIHCSQALLGRIQAHARKHRETEVFGLLVGHPVITPTGRVRTILEDFITAEVYSASDSCYVEVSASELLRMHAVAEERGKRAAGWFHTHPGHGIFMSGTDRNNHQVYTLHWQVALVVDPQHETWGFFMGQDCHQVSRAAVIDESGWFATGKAEPAIEGPRDPPNPDAGPPGGTGGGDSAKETGAEAKRDDGEPPVATALAVVAPEPAVPESPRETPPGKVYWPGMRALLGGLALALCMLLGITYLLRGKLAVQQSLLEESTARIRDLQQRIDELSRRACVQE